MQHRFAASFLFSFLFLFYAFQITFADAEPSERYGMTDYLLHENESPVSPAFTNSIQQITLSAQADDILITVTDALYDGHRLALCWMAENLMPQEPAIVSLESMSVNGKPFSPGNADGIYPMYQFLPDPVGFFTPEDTLAYVNPTTLGGFTYGTSEGFSLAEDLQITLSFSVLRPAGELVVVDESMYVYDERKEAANASLLLVAPEDDLNPSTWIEKGYTPIYISGHLAHVGISGAFQLEQPEQTVQTASLPFSFTVKRSPQAYEKTFVPIEAMQIGDKILTIESLTLTPLSTLLSLSYAQDPALLDSDRAYREPHCTFFFLDEEDHIIAELSMGSSGSWNKEVQADGAWRLSLTDIFPAPIKMPHAIGIGFFHRFGIWNVQTLDELYRSFAKDEEVVVIPLIAQP